MRWLALIALLLAGSAYAGPSIDPTGGLRWVAPPAKYNHPFAGTIKTYREVTPFALGAFWPTYGYTYVIPGTRTCIMQVWQKYWSTSLYRHERAHCNGWPWWHPSN